MSQAQVPVLPETTLASDASTSLRASSVAEDGIKYDIVAYYNNKLPANKAYTTAKEVVEKGVGN